jgi:hypothetical protein
MPSGDGTVTETSPDSTLDEDAAPSNGLEPDTAPDGAGEEDFSAASDTGIASDVAAEPEPTAGEEGSVAPSDNSSETAGESERDGTAGQPSTLTELDGPALDNEEMHTATADLRSSQQKSAEAKEIVGDLVDDTLPGSTG